MWGLAFASAVSHSAFSTLFLNQERIKAARRRKARSRKWIVFSKWPSTKWITTCRRKAKKRLMNILKNKIRTLKEKRKKTKKIKSNKGRPSRRSRWCSPQTATRMTGCNCSRIRVYRTRSQIILIVKYRPLRWTVQLVGRRRHRDKVRFLCYKNAHFRHQTVCRLLKIF